MLRSRPPGGAAEAVGAALQKRALDRYVQGAFSYPPEISASSRSSRRFTSSPQAKPVRAPFFPTTRWQGVKISSGFQWLAMPTARAARGRPTNSAISP